MMSENRNQSVDVIKGVCILLMVWAHWPRMGTLAATFTRVVQFVYTFHMPGFVLITGYFFSKKIGTAEEFVINKSILRKIAW